MGSWLGYATFDMSLVKSDLFDCGQSQYLSKCMWFVTIWVNVLLIIELLIKPDLFNCVQSQCLSKHMRLSESSSY